MRFKAKYSVSDMRHSVIRWKSTMFRKIISPTPSSFKRTPMKKTPPWVLVRKWNIPTERQPMVLEVSAKFVGKMCRVVSTMGPHSHNLGSIDRSRYSYIRVAPELSSHGWKYPVLGPILLRKSGSVENRTQNLWICSQELWSLDHRSVHAKEVRSLN
jgi:hypothetical protein